MIFGLLGACRTDELVNCCVQDLQYKNDMILVNVPDSKNHESRSFVINGAYLNYVKKYAELRPAHTTRERFFLQYRKGKCIDQVIGKNAFVTMSKSIARYLNLPNPEKYTSHCYRRTSATVFVDNGAYTFELQRLGGWKSAAVAQSYVDESMRNKKQAADRFSTAISLSPAEMDTDEPASLIEEQLPGKLNYKNILLIINFNFCINLFFLFKDVANVDVGMDVDFNGNIAEPPVMVSEEETKKIQDNFTKLNIIDNQKHADAQQAIENVVPSSVKRVSSKIPSKMKKINLFKNNIFFF